MYGKLFEGVFGGSMFGSGPTVFAVWAYVIANGYDSHVELNPKLLAATIGTGIQDIEDAISFLGRPDSDSRNKDHDGRRLIRIEDLGGFQYFIPSWEFYNGLRNEEARREQNRAASKKYRQAVSRRKQPSASVSGCQQNQPPSAPLALALDVDKKTLCVSRTATGFEAFWDVWPASARKVAKAACIKSWLAKGLDSIAPVITANVKAMITTKQWQDGFEPAPLTYLNQRRWEDDANQSALEKKPWAGAVN